MQDEKLIAELSGKTESGFGRAGLAGLPGTGSNVSTSGLLLARKVHSCQFRKWVCKQETEREPL